MSSDEARRNRWFEELAKQGVPTVETRLSQGVYGEHNERLVREWLSSQEPAETLTPTPLPARGTLNLMRLLPVGVIRKKPGRVITWVIVGIVVLEVLGYVAAAIFSSP